MRNLFLASFCGGISHSTLWVGVKNVLSPSPQTFRAQEGMYENAQKCRFSVFILARILVFLDQKLNENFDAIYLCFATIILSAFNVFFLFQH